ncbi:phosphoribosylanthranilate isomerase [Paraburkholderia phenoliruptrix]|uniref:phosphoribosylanthranilate isomerase n=1 Tax=Paraburkholderia phenoliruptrix TaxID=252970 RepID=UPI001C50229F|nr:phosphoribosylanthranilate isomerase [Paraburkholderia phenoliruptrix]MBW0445956.1 phosphoribosylanthranilate isomerase [Paraburkholderia phenoliruptrix]MBW9101307.1 phosphoribosylanthranilate isomerase [Paraburkholderia phenoliruptrix]
MERAGTNMSSTDILATDNAAAASDARGGQQAVPRRTRIKLCGLSKAADVSHAVDLGADAIGLVFYPPSPRTVSVAQAVELVRDVPPFVSVVGLFVNPTPDWLREVVSNVGLSLLQFHGDETADQCESLAGIAGLPWLRALRVASDTQSADLVKSALNYSGANGFLFDTHVEGYGGGGKVFDWSLIPAELARRAVLSGGLNAQNVSDAIHRVRPYAVDVSSGIEVPGAKGVKDHARMAAFVRAVRAADAG